MGQANYRNQCETRPHRRPACLWGETGVHILNRLKQIWHRIWHRNWQIAVSIDCQHNGARRAKHLSRDEVAKLFANELGYGRN